MNECTGTGKGEGVESKDQCCREFYTWDNISELSWVGKSTRTLSPPPLSPLTYYLPAPPHTHTLNWSLNEGNPKMDWGHSLEQGSSLYSSHSSKGADS